MFTQELLNYFLNFEGSILKMKLLIKSLLLMLVFLVEAHAVDFCSDPPPYDTTSPLTISPWRPKASDEIIYWVAGPEYILESYQLEIVGSQISIITYVKAVPTFPGYPPNCNPIVLGRLAPGIYTLTQRNFFKIIGDPYPAMPTVSVFSPFTVSPITNVPTLKSSILVALVLMLGWIGSKSLRGFNVKI
jgi:hypothetical protein